MTAFVRTTLIEAAKLPAFVRRDFLIAWSYRFGFLSDWVAVLVQVMLFYFVSLLVDPVRLPTYDGATVTYLEFVVVGLAVGMFVQLGLGRVAGAIRNEQLAGTLESLLLTPTRSATVQIGAALYELVQLPIRIGLFIVILVVGFGLDLEARGVLPAAVLFALLLPFVWGIGLLSAAATLTFRRGAGTIGIGALLLTISSGAYFPLELLPDRIETVSAAANPLALGLRGMREGFFGADGWRAVPAAAAVMAPAAIASLAVGFSAFRIALRRERRLGTLGQY